MGVNKEGKAVSGALSLPWAKPQTWKELTGSWWGSATPSSVTRQHYQRCCTCALDINYHFLLTVCIFIYAFSFRIMRHSWVSKIFIQRMSAPISQLVQWVKHTPVQGKWKMPVFLLSSRHPGCSISPSVGGNSCATIACNPGLPSTGSPGCHPLWQLFILLRN